MKAFKHKLGLKDYYNAMVLAFPSLLRRKKTDRKFRERLMLAVTEVNGCEACSYAHSLMALKKGFSREEIDSFLSGSAAYVHPEEAQGILFAQHYADSRGRPEREVYQVLNREYGTETSKDIVATVQTMHAGNMIGIPYSALMSRLKGKPYLNSSFLYELGMHFSSLVVLPVSLFHTLLRWISGKENIRFAETGGSDG